MSGTNTMCVVTVLLETGMLPMTEPVTELTLEAPAGLIRVTRRLPRRQGHAASRSATCRPSRRTSARRSRCRTLGTVVVDVAYGGMFYVIAEAEPFGLRLTPGRGRRHRAHHRDDQGRRQRAAAGRPPGAARVRGDHDRPAVRAGPRSGEQPAERRHRLDRDARLGAARRPGPARSTARRAGPARRAGWRRSTRRGELGVGDAFRHEGILGTVFTGRRGRGDDGRAVPGDRPDDHAARPGSPASRATSSIPTDPFPDGFTVGDIWA